MTCAECVLAVKHPTTGLYGSGCRECEARGLASTPMAYAAYKRSDPGPLQTAMRLLWTDPEHYRIGRIAVDRWYRALHPTEETT